MRKDEFSDHSFLRQRDLHGRWSYGIGEGCRLIDTGRQSLVRQNLTVVIYASRSNIALPGKGGCSVLIVVKGVACTKTERFYMYLFSTYHVNTSRHEHQQYIFGRLWIVIKIYVMKNKAPPLTLAPIPWPWIMQFIILLKPPMLTLTKYKHFDICLIICSKEDILTPSSFLEFIV